MPRKQRHTAKRVFDRLRDECVFTGGYTIIKDHMRERDQCRQEVFVPLSHSPGHAQAELARTLDAGQLPNLACMRALFSPDPAKLPTVHVQLASLNGYEALIGTGEAA